MGLFKVFKGLVGLAAIVVGTVTGQVWLTAIGIAIRSIGNSPALSDAALTFQNSSINTQNAVAVIYGRTVTGPA